MLTNAYQDARRARAYARLEFPASYYLAFRDLPALLAEHVEETEALDFGCGAGRSTRFLARLGYHVTGVDVAADMLERARLLDPGGSYHLIDDRAADPLQPVASRRFDVVLAAYPFDNIPGRAHRARLMEAIRGVLRPAGRFLLLASAPEIYTHEWATFTTAAFPENRRAGSGDVVRIVIKEGGDDRPVEDLLWLDEDYRETFRRAGLAVRAVHRPLARPDEPFEWVSEERVSPWVIYVTEVAGRR
ncbi:MAG: class I SAM-dependent methyltransferase [Gemmatimonadota bacterium]